ncbi:hypothetical protein Glove_284g104 [Diversispora epigaea]|uniref:UBX domain-containing protein n=1 Tax=Diversispora epigaea TaxID=1348612 RepID=A0A397I6F9_9GLOM|nr:hypothetical protein Glove_284g104 [Diversispora epigaea]
MYVKDLFVVIGKRSDLYHLRFVKIVKINSAFLSRFKRIMASNVIVLLSNGKRQAVKTTPMMTLKQIVNSVCEKQGILDVEKWGLKQNRTILDLGLSVRFANLAPGAKLELIRVNAPKAHSDVQIALQLDDGGRIIGKFPITISLWDILIYFENKEDQNEPLNLTKRLAPAPQTKKKNFFKKMSKAEELLFYQQPVCLLLNQEYGTIPMLKSTTLQSAGITSGNAVLRLLFRHTDLSIEDVWTDIVTPQPSFTQVPTNEKNEKVLVNSSSSASSSSNVQSVPNIPKVPSVPNVPDVQSVQSVPNVPDLIVNSSSAGVTEVTDTDPVIQSSDTDPVIQSSDIDPVIRSSDIDPVIQSSDIDPVIQSSDIDPVIQSSDQGHFDRDVKVFNPIPENVPIPTNFEIPDSFYELTPLELKYLLSMQSSKRANEENAGFKTSTVRAHEEKEKEAKYPKTLIRVRFPDRFQLQIAFLTKEKVTNLYEFVRGTLRSPHRAFELYISPPKKILSDQSLSFFQAGLSPASIVYFNWLDKSDEDQNPYLTEEFLSLGEDIPITTIENNTSLIPENSTASVVMMDSIGHTLSEPSQRKEILSKSNNNHNKHNKGGGGNKIPNWLKKHKK